MLEQTKKALEDERKRSATWQEECNTILAKYGSEDQKALQEARTRCDGLQKEVDALTRAAEASARERGQLQKVPPLPLPGTLPPPGTLFLFPCCTVSCIAPLP